MSIEEYYWDWEELQKAFMMNHSFYHKDEDAFVKITYMQKESNTIIVSSEDFWGLEEFVKEFQLIVPRNAYNEYEFRDLVGVLFIP